MECELGLKASTWFSTNYNYVSRVEQGEKPTIPRPPFMIIVHKKQCSPERVRKSQLSCTL